MWPPAAWQLSVQFGPATGGGECVEGLKIVRQLLDEEGLCLGGSTGINIAGAIRLAKDLGPGHTIVTILCDYGTRYQSKLYNPAFLAAKGLPAPRWLAEPRRTLEAPFVAVP